MEHAGKHRPLAKMLDWDISVFTFDNTTIFILFSSNTFQNVLFPVTSAFWEHQVPWTAPAAPAVLAGAVLRKYQKGRWFPAISPFSLEQHWIVTSKYATVLVILHWSSIEMPVQSSRQKDVKHVWPISAFTFKYTPYKYSHHTRMWFLFSCTLPSSLFYNGEKWGQENVGVCTVC